MKTKLFLPFFILLYLYSPLSAQSRTVLPDATLQNMADSCMKSTTIFNEWQQETLLQLKLVTDIDYLLSDKKKTAKYIDDFFKLLESPMVWEYQKVMPYNK